MEKLLKLYPGREVQIDELITYYGDGEEELPSAIPAIAFVYGMHAVGKTSVVTSYLELAKINYAVVNCIECYTNKLLFEPILNKILPHEERKCDCLMDFLNYIQAYAHQGHFDNKTTVIVFDGIENLDNFEPDFLRALSRLQYLTDISTLGVIFISHLLPEKFNDDITGYLPIYFKQYNKDEIISILMLEKPKGVSNHFYQGYLNSALSVFLRATRDLNELRILILNNFKKYCEPIDNGLAKKEDAAALWRHVIPHLRASILSTYSGTGPNREEDSSDSNKGASSARVILSFDLPYYSKYFLISAYLASHNHPKNDKRLFLQNHGKQRKRVDRKNKKKDTIGSDLLGPRVFSLDRLLAIFYSIIEDKASLTANLMVEISTLVELRLLTKMGDGCLDKPKYKCAASLLCVDTVAKTVGFNVKKYLLD